MVTLAIVGLFGLMFGSFLNVVIYRFDDWLSIIKTRSHCRDCKQQLSWLDLIPLFSFVVLKGRCRYCLKPIAWQYPLVEALSAFFLIVGFVHIRNFEFDLLMTLVAFSAYALTIGVLIVIFFHDLYEMLISDYLNYFLIGSALLYSISIGLPIRDVILGALVAALPIALLVYPSRGRWMGEGDVKLALGLGVFLGYPLALVLIPLSFIFGGVFGSIAILSRQAKLKSAIPFAPFLIVGALIAFFYGELLIDRYLEIIGYNF